MATRSERDKSKSQQERHQQILAKLLKEEDNKYCVDCDAKGPRWASWNLGVFLCIRCAGIHRNLGVHISKVKSVNLDTWTQEQLAMVQEMGNSRARAVYEANLPDHFRRPQTDSTLEAFVRAKYEQKKYIAKEWVPPQPKVQPVVEKEKRKPRPRLANSTIQLSGVSPSHRTKNPAKSTATSRPESKAVSNDVTAAPPPPKTEPVKKKESSIDDLIGLALGPTLPAGNISSSSSSSNPLATASSDLLLDSTTKPTAVNGDSSVSAPAASDNDLFSDFISSNSSTEGQGMSASNGLEPSLFGTSGGEEKKSTKDSIMALYSSGGNQQSFGIPGGVYMSGQQQQNHTINMMANGMMPNMMGQGSVGMVGMTQPPNTMMAQGMQNVTTNLMVVDPVAELRTNIIHAVRAPPSHYPQFATNSMGWETLATNGPGMTSVPASSSALPQSACSVPAASMPHAMGGAEMMGPGASFMAPNTMGSVPRNGSLGSVRLNSFGSSASNGSIPNMTGPSSQYTGGVDTAGIMNTNMAVGMNYGVNTSPPVGVDHGKNCSVNNSVNMAGGMFNSMTPNMAIPVPNLVPNNTMYQQQAMAYQLASMVDAGWQSRATPSDQYNGYYQPPQMVMGAMPGMQSGNMMAGAAMPGQMTGMGPACYNMGQGGYNMAATSMYNNMAPQQPVAAKQPFQQLANQMAGMSMGSYQQAGGITAGGATWGTPQPGQTLSTNLWQ